MKHDSRYGSRRWKALRRLVLDRDGWRCTVEHAGCRYTAPWSLASAPPRVAHVHHIRPPVDGGPFWDETNLTSVCASFNIAERNQRFAAPTAAATAYPPPSREW